MNQSKARARSVHLSNELLRSELSAVQTYEMAIQRHPGLAAAFELERISNEHRRSARLLTSAVWEMGGEPAAPSDAWGTFTNSVRTAADFPSARSMVESLRQGEEKFRNDYEDALDSDDLAESLKELIRLDLLTGVEDHITSLESVQIAVT